MLPIACHSGFQNHLVQCGEPSGYYSRKILALANLPREILSLADNSWDKYLGILYSDYGHRSVMGYYHDFDERKEDVTLFKPNSHMIKKISQRISELRDLECFDSRDFAVLSDEIEKQHGLKTNIYYNLRMGFATPHSSSPEYWIEENGKVSTMTSTNESLYRKKEIDIFPIRNLPNSSW